MRFHLYYNSQWFRRDCNFQFPECAPVAQWIEQWFPVPCAGVRFPSGVFFMLEFMEKRPLEFVSGVPEGFFVLAYKRKLPVEVSFVVPYEPGVCEIDVPMAHRVSLKLIFSKIRKQLHAAVRFRFSRQAH